MTLILRKWGHVINSGRCNIRICAISVNISPKRRPCLRPSPCIAAALALAPTAARGHMPRLVTPVAYDLVTWLYTFRTIRREWLSRHIEPTGRVAVRVTPGPPM